jgi:hypothetical protein
MSFVQREIDRLHSEILKTDENTPAYAQLHAAQQALGWALEPTGVKSPYDMIMGIQIKTEDCLSEPHPPQSSDICGHCA